VDILQNKAKSDSTSTFASEIQKKAQDVKEKEEDRVDAILDHWEVLIYFNRPKNQHDNNIMIFLKAMSRGREACQGIEKLQK
jgi:hypothetical protein